MGSGASLTIAISPHLRSPCETLKQSDSRPPGCWITQSAVGTPPPLVLRTASYRVVKRFFFPAEVVFIKTSSDPSGCFRSLRLSLFKPVEVNTDQQIILNSCFFFFPCCTVFILFLYMEIETDSVAVAFKTVKKRCVKNKSKHHQSVAQSLLLKKVLAGHLFCT